MAREPYHIARQEHLGNMLDQLQDLGILMWRWDYERRSAVYWITLTGCGEHKFDTKRAEDLVSTLCKQQGIIWLPVPHPGGEVQLAATRRRIEELEHGRPGSDGNFTLPDIAPITPQPFDVAAYPTLGRSLAETPGVNRSAQVFRTACTCLELGLSDSQTKWFLAQYSPFPHKYGSRPNDAEIELDRVIARAHDDTSRT